MLSQPVRKHLELVSSYQPKLNLRETEIAIKKLKDFFERALAEELHLTRVSAPLFVQPESGLNDNLNGVERPVGFSVAALDHHRCEIVHSLAKWKRFALKRYGFAPGEGLYTDMNAIRRDEELDHLHSLYVDQWDWERIILHEERSVDTLRTIVRRIYRCFLRTNQFIRAEYPHLECSLPESIHFITTQELEDEYPKLSPKEREDAAAKRWGAVFLQGIGGRLRSGQRHDGRSPDYDDWNLNGDILFWYPSLQQAVEVSSMGIRVDEQTLKDQLTEAGCENRNQLPFHSALLRGELPYTVGGGIGQSRLCMFFLEKVHIGEVQASVWPEEMTAACEAQRIDLL